MRGLGSSSYSLSPSCLRPRSPGPQTLLSWNLNNSHFLGSPDPLSLILNHSTALKSSVCSPEGPGTLATCSASLSGVAHLRPCNSCLLLTWAPASRPHLLQGLPDPSAARCSWCPALRAHASESCPGARPRPHLGGRKPRPWPRPLCPTGDRATPCVDSRNWLWLDKCPSF